MRGRPAAPDPSPAGAVAGAGGGTASVQGSVLLLVEQLRRGVPGGIGTYAAGLVGGLRQLPEDEVPRVVLYASASPTRPDPLTGLGLPLETSALPGRLLVGAWDLGLAGPRAGRAAVVHAVSLATPPSGPPLVVTVHDLAWRHDADGGVSARRRRRWHEAALARARRRATRFVVPSEETAGEIVAAGVARQLVSVIAEGADHLPAPDTARARRLLESLGVTDGYLLAVGTLEPRKNLARLFAAYRAAVGELPEPWPLVVVGPAGGGRVVAPIEGVRLAGRVEEAVLAGLYAGARCACYVPLTEGFGLPVVEAMAAGVPVVSSPVPSAGGASLVVDPLDVEEMAAGIATAASDDFRRAALVEAGNARVAGLTWRRAAAAHVELWRQVAAGAA